jgi:quinol monooxygenase YgiN
MSEFIQIMRFRTDDVDTLRKLSEQYEQDTAGRSTVTTSVMGQDLDTGEYVVVVTFPSQQAVDENNALPETQALAEATSSLATDGPSFSNIAVID